MPLMSKLVIMTTNAFAFNLCSCVRGDDGTVFIVSNYYEIQSSSDFIVALQTDRDLANNARTRDMLYYRILIQQFELCLRSILL